MGNKNESENEDNNSLVNDSLFRDENIFDPIIEKPNFSFNCGNSPIISPSPYSDNLIDMVQKTTNYQTNNNCKQDKKAENDIEENNKEKEDKKNEEEKKPANENIIFSIPNMENILDNNNKIKNMKLKGKKICINNNIYTINKIISILEKHNNNNKFNIFIIILINNEKDMNTLYEMNTKKYNELKKNNQLNKHNKHPPDNIIKKIKVHLIRYLIIFINSILTGFNKCKKYKIKKLDYEIVSNIKKVDNIKYLNITIKELLSLEISTKYTSKDNNANEIIIKKILEKGKEDEKIQYVFNLKFKEWIDIFIMKKESEIVKIDGLDLFLKEILEKNQKEKDKNDEKYFVKFVYYLYNFERWFLNKKNRKILKSK